MTIALNYYLNVRNDEDGTQKLFGKCGFQTMSPKTDRYTLTNLSAIERAMAAGELTDLEGNPVKDGAVIQIFARVNTVKEDGDIDQVTSIRNAHGGDASVPAPGKVAAAAGANADDPF